MKRKFGVEGELEVVGSHATWRNCMWDMRNDGKKKWERNLVSSGIDYLKKTLDRKGM